ncbi:cobalt ABC transporter, inner membrane subunit CbiQ [Methanothermus fervidus DSM 2088]|uniref:Cobalt ABC transporter, inner membrane subunit CbiQ n=1 Tax=Methanothermus fervidus (strain ATCC 43054 / DSM 2088 / JCM 10308 / V24 S) TaxID=523846 RepID=E3GVY4_METFV|nr:cobalt ECF transporter T component CbiQ [Methanothermus fervidus]ADP77749.1 cobalt ABC transporter, inner membrane subunit CbiQ [Methanothermus fervidus DSM 2088]
MFENNLDYIAHTNKLRNVNPELKIFFAISTMIVNLISNSILVPLIIVVIVGYLLIRKAGISKNFYCKFMFIPFVFALITFIFMAFFFGVGKPLLNLGIFGLSITEDGLNRGLTVFTKIIGGFSCLAFLAITTPINEFFKSLKKFKIPEIFLEITTMMYTSIFIIIEEGFRMYYSQETRLGYRDLKTAYKSLGMLAANLFLRAWERGEKLYLSMESRCYQGKIPSLKKNSSPDIKYFILLIFFEVSLFCTSCVSHKIFGL